MPGLNHCPSADALQTSRRKSTADLSRDGFKLVTSLAMLPVVLVGIRKQRAFLLINFYLVPFRRPDKIEILKMKCKTVIDHASKGSKCSRQAMPELFPNRGFTQFATGEKKNKAFKIYHLKIFGLQSVCLQASH